MTEPVHFQFPISNQPSNSQTVARYETRHDAAAGWDEERGGEGCVAQCAISLWLDLGERAKAILIGGEKLSGI